MASHGTFWWVTPLQCLTTISAAVNFGASGFQTPITMPVLRNENVPAHHASTLVTHLLHVSEIVFPPLNAIGTVGNLAILGGVFANKSEITPEISAKIPYIATSFALSVAVTVYALTVMVPINTTMKNMAARLRKDESDKEAARIFREHQLKWQGYNMGRGSLMLGAAIASVISLVA